MMARESVENAPETGLAESPSRNLEDQFARLMMRLSGGQDPLVGLTAALLCRATAQGHVCLDLREAPALLPQGPSASLPPPGSWEERLLASGVAGRPGDRKPLVLDRGHRLYLYRYWRYEHTLAQAVLQRAEARWHEPSLRSLKEAFSRYFPPMTGPALDWQRVAAFSALTHGFSVVSGGPGTGKSTLVGVILALFLHLSEGKKVRVALAAPTGKAASRLQEAMETRAAQVGGKDLSLQGDVGEAATLHRLLGTRVGSPRPRHHRENPLPADLVVVDEASMVDLSLMSRLVEALPPGARLILLGDHHQLSSVEAGAVLGDLCRGADGGGYSPDFVAALGQVTGLDLSGRASISAPAVADSVVRLRENYRFGPQSGIGALSNAVLAGDGQKALALLKEGGYADLSWRPLPAAREMASALGPVALSGYGPYLRARDPAEALSRFGKFRILCALRGGPFGVAKITEALERVFSREGLIRRAGRWYGRRPVMITTNDYSLSLFNGDIGFLFPDPGTGTLRAWFQGRGGSIRPLSPPRLPVHETVFVMTVHKSQGSEFDEAVLILPDRDAPLLTRELLYTAVTRARQRVTIWADEEVFLQAVARRTRRSSGLAEALWGEDERNRHEP